MSPSACRAPTAKDLRWRRVFPGDEPQIRELRQWLATLLPECPARDDVIAVAAELSTNAVRHTASGRGGWFAAEITWHPACVRIAVADQGAPTAPRLPINTDPMTESGHGLVLILGIARRTGMTGDQRGRLVWADVPWDGWDAPVPAALPDGYEAAIRDGRKLLARRYREVPAWFGRSTLQWWALAGNPGAHRLVAANSPHELAQLLDTLGTSEMRRTT